MNDLLTQLSDFLSRISLPVAVGIAVALTVAVFKAVMALKSKFDAAAGVDLSNQFWKAVAFAVQSAEQSGLLAGIKLKAEEKKRLAIDFLEGQLKMYGLDIDLDVIDAAIETAIANRWQEMVTTPDGVVDPSSLSDAGARSRALKNNTEKGQG